VSGNGGAKTVDEQLARKALVRALGWAAALHALYPKAFDQANPDWPDLFSVAPLGDSVLQGDAILEYLAVHNENTRRPADDDTQRRACSRARAVVAFAEAVNLGARERPIELSFM
jgi:hypothetical protein